MNFSIRSILSSVIALGLAGFAIISACAVGVASTPALVSFGLLAVYGLVEIALVSYQSPHFVSARRPAVQSAACDLIAWPTDDAAEIDRAA